MILIIPMHIMIHITVHGDPGSPLVLALASAWAMDMEAMVTLTMAMVTHPTAGVTHPTAGVIHITDTDRTGQDIIADIMMGIMVEADTIILHLITLILMVDVATGMVTAIPGQVIRNMVPGA